MVFSTLAECEGPHCAQRFGFLWRAGRSKHQCRSGSCIQACAILGRTTVSVAVYQVSGLGSQHLVRPPQRRMRRPTSPSSTGLQRDTSTICTRRTSYIQSSWSYSRMTVTSLTPKPSLPSSLRFQYALLRPGYKHTISTTEPRSNLLYKRTKGKSVVYGSLSMASNTARQRFTRSPGATSEANGACR